MRLETRLPFSAAVLLLLLTLSAAGGCSRPAADPALGSPAADPALGYMDRIVKICGEAIPHLEKDLKLAGKSGKEQVKVLAERAALARDIQVRVSALGHPPSDHGAVSDWLRALEVVAVEQTVFAQGMTQTNDYISLALSFGATNESISAAVLGRASAAGLPECETRGWLLDSD